MSNRKLVKELGMPDEQAQKAVDELLSLEQNAGVEKVYDESMREFQVDTILKGKILNVLGDDVIVDIGYKSEGIVPLSEFPRPEDIEINKEIEVLLEQVEDEAGVIVLSKQKADRIRGWERIITQNKEGDVVRGRVIRKIKGGLLVDVGVPVFLPASQVDIRRVDDIGELLGKEIECRIIKIDEKRMNIIVSRRKLLEEQRADLKTKLLAEIKEGDVIKGVVKNIADFGCFVDLGGIDGLLHITDMSWGRITHPSEMIALDQELQIKVLKIDRTTERIALGLKQLSRNPWDNVADKYTVGSRAKGKVVNLLPYGAFVELEEGVEGLIHISEMSWTQRVNHPSELLSIGDSIEVIVLNVNTEKQELSLGLKQTEANPWETANQRYQQGMKVTGRVRNTTTYGAFIKLDDGLDGLLHINDMSWTRRITHPSEVVKKGEKIDVVILSVDQEKRRIALGLKQLQDNPWQTKIPEKYAVGMVITGKVTKLASFGAFVELEADLEGLLHLARSGEKGSAAPPTLGLGDLIEVKVVKLDPKDFKIGLALQQVVESKPQKTESPAPPPPQVEKEIQ